MAVCSFDHITVPASLSPPQLQGALTYSIITSGDCLSHGLSWIDTAEECSRAGAAVGVSQSTNPTTYHSGAPYCFKYYGTLYFNGPGTSPYYSNASHYYQMICKSGGTAVCRNGASLTTLPSPAADGC